MHDLDEAIGRYHLGLAEFVRGDAEPMFRLFSQRDDVVWCNPFRPFARGPREVQEAVAQAASHFAHGECEFETITAFGTAELAYTVELEKFRAMVDGSEGSGALRVTTIFRLEDGDWRVTHRHADPITTPQATPSIPQH